MILVRRVVTAIESGETDLDGLRRLALRPDEPLPGALYSARFGVR